MNDLVLDAIELSIKRQKEKISDTKKLLSIILKAIREHLMLSQEDFIYNLMSQSKYSRLERGESNLSIELFAIICQEHDLPFVSILKIYEVTRQELGLVTYI